MKQAATITISPDHELKPGERIELTGLFIPPECQDCITAARVPSHAFTSGCPGCIARAVSRGRNYRTAMNGGDDRNFRRECGQFGTTVEEVQEAARMDAYEHS